VKFWRKPIAILFIGLFLGNAIGISIYKHYCGDLLEAVSIYVQANPCMDDGCTMEADMGCCEDEYEFIQMEYQLHKVEKQHYQFELPIFSLLSPSEKKPALLFQQAGDLQAALHPPPEINRQILPAYISHQQLIFYG
jgi:hypothetical protein